MNKNLPEKTESQPMGKKNTRKSWYSSRRWSLPRIITQTLFLLLFFFLFLQTESKGTDKLGYPVELFLEMDPLVALSTFLSGRSWPEHIGLCLLVIAITAVLGRVFCGWVCPLGTLHNMMGAIKKWKGPQRVRNWFHAKYLLLIFLLSGSLVGIQLTGVFDPISLLIRHLTIGVYPAFNYSANGTMDFVYRTDVGLLTSASDWIYDVLKKTVLAFQQPYFAQGALLSLLFLVILLLNLSERRFWCRYLCPLGALLGFLGRLAPFKRKTSKDCNSCGLCDQKCQGGIKTEAWKASECLYCMSCGDECPKKAVAFGFYVKPAEESVEIGRRNVLLAGGAGLASVAVSRATPLFNPTRPNPNLIRPPGALPEPEFLARCVKCGACMKVCTTNALQPTFLEAGLEGLWSPVVVPRVGYCEFNCTLCGQVCPTGAIQLLTPAQKREWRIGTAMFDLNRCLPHAHNTPCIVCEEVCPTPKKSIWFKEVLVQDRNGQELLVQQPRVDLKNCTGCGICVTKCPLVDAPGVRITSIGETRSKKNQILLSNNYY
ncbi:MAG: 4Fe-4S binding protein [Holophagales bacterium]|nr:4Fe-4S binding protein [Holophagales bacterium]